MDSLPSFGQISAAARVDSQNTSDSDRELIDQEARDEATLKLRKEIQALAHIGSIHRMRKFGLGALFFLVLVWLLVICLFVLGSSFSLQVLVDANVPAFKNAKFNGPILALSDPVLISLITSTTLNVLGMFAVAAKWLYSTPKQGASKNGNSRSKSSKKK